MSKQNSVSAAFSILLIIFIGLGCSGSGAQTDQANKLIDEANKIVADAKDLIQKTEQRNNDMFNVNFQTASQLQLYKLKMKDEAQDIVANYAKVADMANEASKKFGDASKLDLSDKFKEYLNLKSQEFAKRGEAANISKGNAQSFIDYDDIKQMKQRFAENNEKADKLSKEADDLSAKADKIHDDNKDIFKN